MSDVDLQSLSIAAAHHREIAEMAIEEGERVEMADALLDAGNALDGAILKAYEEGASLHEMWRATKHLPVLYLLQLTTGQLSEDPDNQGDDQ